MPAHCKIEDPLKLDIILLPFGLNDMGTPLFDCLRILCGTVNFRNKKTNRLIKPRKCFVSNRKRTIKKSTLDDLISVVFDGDLKQKDLKEALVKGSNDNKTFWEDLRAELCLCIVAREKGLNVDAFLYLYRIFELVSIALPLVYISSLSDYKKSMDFVKSLSNNTNDGELTVFKNFVSSSQLMRDYRYLVIDFDTNHEDEKWRCVAA